MSADRSGYFCRYYGSTAGCKYGDSCTFSHSNPESIRICYNYNTQYGCVYAQNCHFRHINNINHANQPLLMTPITHIYPSVITPILQYNPLPIYPPQTVNITQQLSSKNKLFECIELNRLKYVMQRYSNDHVDNDEFYDKLPQILDDFFYLLSTHNNDEEFEFIYNELGYCDINKCNISQRHFLYRSIQSQSNIIHNILDKIHCYFQHCYDIGNKLSSNDKLLITQHNPQKDNDDSDELYLFNAEIMKINEILYNKRKLYRNIDHLNNRSHKKFNQFSVVSYHQKNDIKDDKMYSFGARFYYDDKQYFSIHTDHKRITSKYSSIKEELVTNEISTVTVQQYDMEYKKCKIYFNSEYKRQNAKWNAMRIYHMISLIIYCNYTELQYQFSKTYRNNIEKHNNFYYLGKYLKKMIHQFGTTIFNGNIKTFYHGISETLSFPSYIENVCICCPLSTSSSLGVALNFTNNNNGLIVEFKDLQKSEKSPKYFSVSWLSDFANENEYLFIQNRLKYALSIHNIVHTKTGCEYGVILDALKLIDRALGFSRCNKIHIEESEENCALATRIVEHQLSLNEVDSYKALSGLNKYAQGMINTYCKNRASLDFNNKYSFITKMFRPSNNLLKLQRIIAMFPNLRKIAVSDIKICSSILDDVLVNLDSGVIDRSNALCISLYCIPLYGPTHTQITNIIHTYAPLFNKFDRIISGIYPLTIALNQEQ